MGVCRKEVKLKEVVRLRGLYTLLTKERGLGASKDDRLRGSDDGICRGSDRR